MTSTSTDDTTRAQTNAVVDRAFELLLAHDMTAFGRLWAPSGTMEFPFAAPGQPERLTSQAEVLEYLSGYTDMLDLREIVSQVRHQTADPQTVIVEFEASGVAVAAKRPYRLRYVAVITVGAEGITNYRDYWSPLAAAAALGETA